jgi:hypothetical protein
VSTEPTNPTKRRRESTAIDGRLPSHLLNELAAAHSETPVTESEQSAAESTVEDVSNSSRDPE